MKWIKRIFIVLALLFLVFSVGIYFYLQSFRPVYEGEISLAGINEEVEVYFDNYGVPHIYAQNEEDAYFALGYIHAKERLFQMEMLRRVGSGRLAEVFGESLAETDRFFRTIGIQEISRVAAKAYMSEKNEPYQKAAQAYLQGLNNYIKNGKTPLEYTLLGLEKEAFTEVDLYCIAGYMAYSFNVAFRTDPILSKIQNKLGDKYTQDFSTQWIEGTQTIPVYPHTSKPDLDSIPEAERITRATQKIFDQLPVPVWLGSNSWVLAGEKTKSGKVFFANDAHIGFGQPSVWYESHLEYPGFSFYGNYIAGMPFAPIGHTRQHAWGITMLENDETDLYQEQLNPDNPNQVKFEEGWEDLKTRPETIKIKGQEDLDFEVKISRHGPIINECIKDFSEISEAPVSAFMTYTRFPNQGLRAFYNFGKAKNLQEFQKACALMHSPGFNVMYGDAQGNIAWLPTAKLIKRPTHVNSKFILDGASGKDDPLGYYDFSENPKSINPPSNYIYSANNQPDSAFGILHQGYYLPEFRARRIVTLLEKEDRWDTDKMKEMITDAVSAKYPEMAQEMVKVIEQQDLKLSQNQVEALELLKNWDGNHALTSLAPTIYYKLLYHIQAEAMLDELGEDDFKAIVNIFMMRRSIPYLLKNEASLWWDDTNTDKKESRADIFVKAFHKSMKELESQFGANLNNWEWQKVHTLTHQHTLGRQGGWLGWFFNVGALPINGGHEVINNLSFQLNPDGTYPVNTGPSMRILIDFNDIENSITVLPTGQSGRVMSKHYDDQAQMYADGEFRKQMMNETEIKENSRKLVLKVK